MIVKTIRLKELAEVKEFVQAAEQCIYDVDIAYNRITIDAKSLIGVMSMDLSNALKVRYSEEDEPFLAHVLDKYAV